MVASSNRPVRTAIASSRSIARTDRKIITERDGDGNILRRTRKPQNGEVVVIIDAKPADKGQIAAGVDYLRRLPPVVLNIPMQQYVVESQAATPQVMEETLIAPPVEQVERPYSLEEIRQSGRLRDKVRRIDVDTVNFEFGQATLAEDQVAELDGIGKALAAVVGRNPGEVFLVEGHTDAVGSDLANLALSDRRAEVGRRDPDLLLQGPAGEPGHAGLWRAVPEGTDRRPGARKPPRDGAADYAAAEGRGEQ